MRDDGAIDLSALDPERDPERWEAYLAATLRRVDVVLERRAAAERAADPWAHIAAWARPVLLAAAAALAVLVPMELAMEAREERAERVERLVALSAGWDPGETPPSGSDFLRALTEEGP